MRPVLREHEDPETGGAFTLKRFRATERNAEGSLAALRLDPHNLALVPIHVSSGSVQTRLIADPLEIAG